MIAIFAAGPDVVELGADEATSAGFCCCCCGTTGTPAGELPGLGLVVLGLAVPAPVAWLGLSGEASCALFEAADVTRREVFVAPPPADETADAAASLVFSSLNFPEVVLDDDGVFGELGGFGEFGEGGEIGVAIVFGTSSDKEFSEPFSSTNLGIVGIGGNFDDTGDGAGPVLEFGACSGCFFGAATGLFGGIGLVVAGLVLPPPFSFFGARVFFAAGATTFCAAPLAASFGGENGLHSDFQ